MLQKFHIFRTCTQAPRLFFFGYSGHSQDMYYIWYIYFRSFGHSAAHYLCTFFWCSGSSAFFFGTFTQAPVLFFSDIPDTPRTCITFGIIISDISDINHLIYLCMLRKFHIFFMTYTWASGLFFPAFAHSSSPSIYLCTSGWCYGGSTYFQDIYPSTNAPILFWIPYIGNPANSSQILGNFTNFLLTALPGKFAGQTLGPTINHRLS